MNLENIAIIPARGSSKRLPKKNILLLDGKPLLGHTIEQAIQSTVFDRIIVSTEDSEIADIGLDYGACIHKRPDKLASDFATVKDVCLDVLESAFDRRQMEVECFCVLTATSVLRTANDIVESYRIFKEGYDFVTSVTEYFFQPHAAMVLSQSSHVEYYWKDICRLQSQRLPRFVVENGAINWCRKEAFLKHNVLLGPRNTIYKMPKHRSIDVDTEEDFRTLELIYNALKEKDIQK